jgi:hypothetical protein
LPSRRNDVKERLISILNNDSVVVKGMWIERARSDETGLSEALSYEELRQIADLSIQAYLSFLGFKDPSPLVELKGSLLSFTMDDGMFLERASRALVLLHDVLLDVSETRFRHDPEGMEGTRKLLSEAMEWLLGKLYLIEARRARPSLGCAGLDEGEVLVIDPGFRILRRDGGATPMSPEEVGLRCFEVLAHEKKPCDGCPAIEALSSGSQSRAPIRDGRDSRAQGVAELHARPVGKLPGSVERIVVQKKRRVGTGDSPGEIESGEDLDLREKFFALSSLSHAL